MSTLSPVDRRVYLLFWLVLVVVLSLLLEFASSSWSQTTSTDMGVRWALSVVILAALSVECSCGWRKDVRIQDFWHRWRKDVMARAWGTDHFETLRNQESGIRTPPFIGVGMIVDVTSVYYGYVFQFFYLLLVRKNLLRRLLGYTTMQPLTDNIHTVLYRIDYHKEEQQTTTHHKLAKQPNGRSSFSRITQPPQHRVWGQYVPTLRHIPRVVSLLKVRWSRHRLQAFQASTSHDPRGNQEQMEEPLPEERGQKGKKNR